MGDVTRVLSGLEDFEVTGAVKAPGGGLEVSVRLARPDAACPRCGTFSSRSSRGRYECPPSARTTMDTSRRA